MGKVREEKPASFKDFVALVEDTQSATSASLWYRGCGRSSYKLLPTLYRHPRITAIAGLAKLEAQLMTRFRQRSIPFHSRALSDDWHALFFMQHYGVPTRLLDWTENPFIAFYFAVMSAESTTTATHATKYVHDAAVWIVDPIIWNRHALRHQSFDAGVLAPGDEALKGYKPTRDYSSMNNHPVALYGAHNSPRIVAQRGVFSIFGQNTAPMEDIYDDDSYPTDSLIKIVLKKSRIGAMRESVLNHGITESVIQPDLDGLASEIKRSFKFKN
jgi:hypothetical protein